MDIVQKQTDKIVIRAISKAEEKDTERNRQTWDNQFEYLLSLFGYTTGIGDFWRFPYLAWRNGGGAFVVAFICAVIVCGIPLYFMELVVSQYSGKSIYGVWDICPLFRGVGISIGILNILVLGYSSMPRYWLVEYMVTSFTGLPWSNCNNTWNTNSCITKDILLYMSSNKTNNQLINRSTMSSEEEFWQYKVLNLSDGINDIGNFRWNVCIYAVVYRLVATAVVIKSVKSIGKAMYIFTVIPLLLITAMWIRTLFLPGATDGIKYFLIPEFSQLRSIKVWIEAIIMAFYSLGPVWGGIFVVGSHSKFNNNCFRAAAICCSADGIMSVFCSIILFSVFGVAAKQLGMDLEQTVNAGMSVGLVGYTRALSYLPLAQVWTIIFFVCVVVTTMDIQVLAQEMIISFFQEMFPNEFRDRRMILIIGTSVLVFILCLPLCTQGGAYMVQILDWYHPTIPILICAVVECLTFMWIYGGDRMDRVHRIMTRRSIPHLLRVSVAFIMPFILVCLIIVSLIKYKPPTYGSYIYPSHVEIIGWLIAVASVLPVPIYIVYQYTKQKGSQNKRLAALIKPCGVWKLKNAEKSDNFNKSTLIGNMWFNLTGKNRTAVGMCELKGMEET